ncbi:MAG: hypothetical protein OEM52_00615 [bacterium]|nr:hypothetical protein [bacterium]
MYHVLYWIYFAFTALFLAALLWSLLRKPDETNPIRKRIPHEAMMAAIVLVPVLLRLLGVK